MSVTSVTTRWRSWAPHILSIVRIVAAFTFMQYGAAKLYGIPIAVMPGGGTVHFPSLLWFAGTLEVYGGSLVLLGLFTRPAAFLLSGEMAVAYFKGHAATSFWTLINQGLPAVLFCFLWLYISAAGPGPWSLDALRRKA